MSDEQLAERLAVSRAIMNILDDWGMELSDRHALLSLPKDIRSRSMEKFRESEPFPDTPDINQRLEHILGIADALRTSHPTNTQMGLYWMRRPCRQLGGRAPMAVMLEDGVSGMVRVRLHLDCTYAWNQSGSAG
ncbi:MAG: DUF2384 domain-containing protein [Gammaproteobacteria bacterium]|nr:DUF2384 domain-containing protein [Gammaproteobacteria bacterium]MCP5136906.1 DUF2384 domain-containing protein [Gammaproteobacteria bacterium]